MSRKAILALVGAFVIVVAASVGVTTFVMSRGEDTAAVQQTAPTNTKTPAGGQPTSGGGQPNTCGLAPSTDPDPTAGATTVKWERIAVYSLPISVTAGPGKRDPKGAWSCYSHDQAGAVMAAYIIGFRADGVAENWGDVTKQQTMPGPEQQMHLDRGATANNQEITPRGFQVAAYSDQKATIRYYLASPNLPGLACTSDVVWSNGDWKLQLAKDGGTASGCSMGDLDNFIPWGP